jgi:sirohydrochlorin cobaltochelatase
MGRTLCSVAERLRAAAQLAVELAYLDYLPPGLDEAVQTLVDKGARSVRIVPLFGRGGHLRGDVLRRVEAIAARLPGVVIDVTLPAGDDDAVQEALVAFCLRCAGSLGARRSASASADARRLEEAVAV